MLSVRATGLASLLGLMLTGCSGSEQAGPAASKFVTYRLDLSGCISIDSVKYNNGSNVMIRVDNPAPGWLTTFAVGGVATMSAQAWGMTCATSSAKLKATWTTPGYASESDSAIVSVGVAAIITLTIPPQAI